MSFKALKDQIIERTKSELGADAPENWDYLTEEYVMKEADDEDAKSEEVSETTLYGNDAYLDEKNVWNFKCDPNDASEAGACGETKKKLKSKATRIGLCSRNNAKYKFVKDSDAIDN